MEHVKDLSTENVRMHDLLDRYFASRRTLKSTTPVTSSHLDDDSLSTFVEGSVSMREAEPVLAHLVECRFCLHKTAELVRLDLEVNDSGITEAKEHSNQPASISTVLTDLFSKIFATSENAVFAHESQDDDVEKENSEEDIED